ncbi:MAG TPA: malectin [Candidatus Dormibacteraeota bacterium]|nr:malectin [Candidatus Dormibacteraeota bacterium]
MKRLSLIFGLMAAACMPAAAQTQQAIRIDCGGPAYTDVKGQVWQADNSYSSGFTDIVNTNIAGTTDQSLYQSARYGLATGEPVIYSFPVAPGAYHVNLYFAETYPPAEKVGGRVFNVKLQDVTTLQNLDIFAAVGANSALVKGTDILATDGQVKIELDSITQVAKINAIEIIQTVAMPQLNLNFVYPDGTPVAGSLNYNVSSAKTGATTLSGNQPLNSGRVTCLLISSPKLLGLFGTMNVNLSLTDTAGHALWQIMLTLNPSSANFASVQSSSLNVVVQKQ